MVEALVDAAIWIGGAILIIAVVAFAACLMVKIDEKWEGCGCILSIIAVAFIVLATIFYFKADYDNFVKEQREAEQSGQESNGEDGQRAVSQ